MAQQTAVEWLENQFDKYTSGGVNVPNCKIFKLTEKAKQMEKEQMEQCYKEGIEDTKKVLKDELKDLLVFPNPYKK